jgi:hypothetical protein
MKKYKGILYFIVAYSCFIAVKHIFFSDDEYLAMTDGSATSGYTYEIDQELPDSINFNFHVKPILSDKCFLCHGPDAGTREAGLRLDVEEGAYAALGEFKDHYAIVPGDTESSKLVYRISSEDETVRMPPPSSNLRLSNYEKQVLIKWIEQGAPYEAHWSFIPPEKPVLPKVSDKSWPRNAIDNFILETLESKGMKPSPEASKEKLVRRLYFDLTGLPPSLEAIDAFLEDDAPEAYENLVDELLDSPAYGERMSSDWLDVARYADSHGYQDDLERTMWPWRDWVIHAFNSNLPYDEFITWQLAGDLLDNPTKEQILATGFNRNHKITQEGGVVDEEYRVEYVVDRTVTTSKSLIGITMECGRCHDHKYDPVSQTEFYEMYSFFNLVDEKGRIEYGEIPKPYLEIDTTLISEELSFIQKPDSINDLKVMVMEDAPEIRKTYYLRRGAYDAPDKEVFPGTPEAILPFDEEEPRNRLGLANWFLDDKNPLTARVTVNRYWQLIFGRGIVSTPADFGNQGALPSHPELLDHLAVTFRESGWNVKELMKSMVMSSTYRQSSRITKEGLSADPENVLLARGPRYKLPAEMIRDNALAVSGLLVRMVGGPSVKPYQPEGLWQETTGGGGGTLTKYVEGMGEQLYRRSLYTFWKRTVPPPSMMTFDTTSRDFCEVTRQKTSTPLQALVLLNDPQYLEAARVLASKVLRESGNDRTVRIAYLFRTITSRFPDDKELEAMENYLEEARTDIETGQAEPDRFLSVGRSPIDEEVDKTDLYLYTTLASIVLNMEETVIKS